MGFWLEFLVVFGVIFVAMVLHELMHGVVAYWLGDETAKIQGRLSLNPMVHIDPWLSLFLPMILFLMGGPVFGGAKPVPIDNRRLRGGVWGMALVALAGPLTNLMLAFVGFLGLMWLGIEAGLLALVFKKMLFINLGLFAFNILPLPPLDGSRILYATMPDKIREGMDRFERGFGMMGVFLMVFLFAAPMSNVMSWIIEGILNLFMFVVG